MKDPAPGQAWTPQQFWVCNRCGRHFWTTYAAPPGAKATPPATPGATTPAPTAQKPAAAAASGEAAATPAAPVSRTSPNP